MATQSLTKPKQDQSVEHTVAETRRLERVGKAVEGLLDKVG
jgi:hypothetical protein